jgi:hypothetical protein
LRIIGIKAQNIKVSTVFITVLEVVGKLEGTRIDLRGVGGRSTIA